MENWRARALELFPEFENQINKNQGGPTGLWNDLYIALAMAYEGLPVNDDLIGRIYDYANWCFQQPKTANAETDLASAAAIGLIENLTLEQAVSEDLHRWLSLESFDGFEALFKYHLTDEKYRKFREDFMRKKKQFFGPSRL